MAQPPLPDQNFYHSHSHPLPLPHRQTHMHGQLQSHSHPQLQLPTQFRSPFDLRIFDERASAVNYNYIRPYMPCEPTQPPDDAADSLVMRRPRRTRTTFTNKQIAELEQHFLQGRYLTNSRVSELAAKLALGTAQVKIWFKNRRRRHKLQTDQHKEFSTSFTCDGMPLSPCMPSSTADCFDGAMVEAANALQPPLSVGSSSSSSDGSTPPNLTPSPTTQANAGLKEPCVAESFQTHYYCNLTETHASLLTPQPQQTYTTLSSGTANSTVAQFFAAPPTALQQPTLQQPTYQTRFPYADFQHRLRGCSVDQDEVVGNIASQDNPGYNYNNPHCVGRTAPAISEVCSTMMAVDAAPPNTQPTAMSPVLGDYSDLELFTTKHNERPSVCSDNNIGGSSSVNVANPMEDTNTKTLQVLGPSSNAADGNDNSADALLILEECTDAFSKCTKLCSDEAHETSYAQCTMDTIMHAYSNHRHTASNTQFAYCYN